MKQNIPLSQQCQGERRGYTCAGCPMQKEFLAYVTDDGQLPKGCKPKLTRTGLVQRLGEGKTKEG